MATVLFKGNPVQTLGELPTIGEAAPDFALVRKDLSEQTLSEHSNGAKILSFFPSLDTPVCAASVHRFWEKAGKQGIQVWNISMDLPFAHGRFCSAEGIEGVEAFSAFRSSIGKDYGIEIAEGPLRGLLSRAVVVVDRFGKVMYVEHVPEITQEPDYEAALAAISS